MSQKTKVVLFNYGGGMRGLIPAHIMNYIETTTKLRMSDLVDVFCGPSTGAILNAALNVPHPDQPTRPKYTAKRMIKFYEREGKNIFPADQFRDFRALIHDFNNRTMKIGSLRQIMRHGHYDPRYLGECLQKLYGDTSLKDSLKSLIIPAFNIDGDALTPVLEDNESEDTPVHTKNNILTEGGNALWIKNIHGDFQNTRPSHEVSMHNAVMATTAAPTYFPCHHFSINFDDGFPPRHLSCIDGSIFDNPCISYHGAVRQHLAPDTRIIMIMLGTGYSLKSINKDQWNSYGNLGVVDPANDLPLINILFHASESALLGSFYDELGHNDIYHFNKSLLSCDPAHKPSIQIDDASPDNIKALKAFAHALIEDHKDRLDQLCHVLVSNYGAQQKEKRSIARRFFQILSFK